MVKRRLKMDKMPKPAENFSAFDKSVNLAVEAEQRFRSQERHVCTGLTAKTYVKEAELQAGLDGDDVDARLEALSAALDKPGRENAAQALRQMVRAIIGDGHMRFGRPSTRINFLVPDEARSELAASGNTPLELFALASRIAVTTRPSAFGLVADMPAAEQKLDELKAEIKDALKAVEQSWGACDLTVDADGKATFVRFPSVVLTNVDLGHRLLLAAVEEAAARSRAA
jgi:hypothetical protein